MKIFEEEHPNAMREIEQTINELMEIEQAEELQNVIFQLYSVSLLLNKLVKECWERNKN
jgi:hypothetical protein